MRSISVSALLVVALVTAPSSAKAGITVLIAQGIVENGLAGAGCMNSNHRVTFLLVTGDAWYGKKYKLDGKRSRNGSWSSPYLGECSTGEFQGFPDTFKECNSTSLCACPVMEGSWFAHSRLTKVSPAWEDDPKSTGPTEVTCLPCG